MNKVPSPPSKLEETFALHIRIHNLPQPKREFKFDLTRQWRFDFAWPEYKIAVECEGTTYEGGRHQRSDGFADDCEKYNTAVILGWSVLRFPYAQIKSEQAVRMTANLLRQRIAQ